MSRCKRCGACKECGAAPVVSPVIYVYPLPQPNVMYPRYGMNQISSTSGSASSGYWRSNG